LALALLGLAALVVAAFVEAARENGKELLP
jgi:hypothetical protein